MDQYQNILQTYLAALQDEYNYLLKHEGKPVKISNVIRVGNAQGEFQYKAETDTELHLPGNFQIHIEIEGKRKYGEIISVEDNTLWFSMKQNVGYKLETATLYCDSKALIDELRKRIKECIRGERKNLSYKFITEGPALGRKGSLGEIKTGQAEALNHALNQDITVIWGPPGTGKTYTLSNIAIQCMEREEKILILSHSNVAVDGAMNSILRILESNKKEDVILEGRVVRYGYVRDKELDKNTHATSYNLALGQNPELRKEKEAIDDRLSDVKKGELSDEEIIALEKRRSEIIKQLKHSQEETVWDADIVGTTLSKVTVDKLFYGKDGVRFNTVIVDEASMAYIPQIIFASSLAEDRFICLGDFRQLAPIVQNRSHKKNPLQEDIFRFLKISDARNNVQYHPWMVMLNEQRRMLPKIAEFSNQLVYSGLIESKKVNTNKRLSSLVKLAPFEGNALGIIDTGEMWSICGKTEAHSHFNILSAIISASYASASVQNADIVVGVITPYAAQQRLINAFVKEFVSNPKQKKIKCSTVHQFQGSECDVIYFDAVESLPYKKPGLLYTESNNDSATRLVNVAITRAKGKFITVANKKYWDELASKDDICFKKLLNYQEQNGKSSPFEFAARNKAAFKEKCFFTMHEEYEQKFAEDLSCAKQTIKMIIPENFVLPEECTSILCSKKEEGISITIKKQSTDHVPDKLKHLITISADAIFPVTIIDDQVIWYGDSRQAVRTKGKRPVAVIASCVNMDGVLQGGVKQTMQSREKLKGNRLKDYIEQNDVCPSCGAPLTLAKSRHYMLSCSACNYHKELEKTYLERFIVKTRLTCPEDGSSVQARTSKWTGVCIFCLRNHFVRIEDI